MSSPDLDRLFAAPLKTFVAERKLLADALKSSGRPQDAKEVQKMPRPSLAAWAVNQLARREAPLVKRLAELTARLRGAQGRLAGAERVERVERNLGYAEALAAHRETLKQLRGRAEELLAASGQAVRPQILERVVWNLRVGMASDETRPTIESGRLVHDVGEKDLVSLLGQPAVGRETDAAAAPNDGRGDRLGRQTREKADREAAARATAEARALARAAAEEARQAERARARARAEAESRTRVLRAAVEGARRTLEREERGVETARAALAEAEERLRPARAEAERAAQELRVAEAALAALH